ncbi:hypothetical protein F4860DRAFT_458277 [Xylaria cubensis]|nr:hypothetical protein F4860DRAFT_458277 [Xylaria cubensis]
MEAFAALGVAVNIAQAIDYGFQLIQKSKDLRERGVTDSALNDDAQRLNNLVTDLTSQQSSKCSGDLRILAVECAKVSETLISELEQLKPTNPKSTLQRAKTIWRRERREDRIKDLERRLQDHKSQLSLHLTSLSRIELNDKLDDISLDTQKMRSELATMHLITKELSNSDHIGQVISRTLEPLVHQSYDCLCQLTELAILDMLHFPDMNERFDTILDAHEETLHWLLDTTGDNDSIRSDDYDSAKINASNDFVTWLRQGDGFFHISGKPGSGKSTLVKYICSHPDLDDHLKVWCQDAQLGRGQFFFWKPGTLAQKSIKGLLRGLLHSLLDKNRSLIPTAFPDLWKHILARSSSSRQLEYRNFKQGFDNLLTYARDSGSYKFVLFIDGLDEFEGQHLDLITTMKGWTEKYPLKICVSSREYGVFLQLFSSYPKLRLHECNLVDIETMVSARLRSNPLCNDLSKSDKALRTIVELIKTRADGVFIWVSLILAGIEDAIISGADLPELEERIYAYPDELDDLYWHLVHLIHETDRKWAFGALEMVRFAQYNDQFNYLNISLLQLSFLDEIQYDAAAGFLRVSGSHSMTAVERMDNTRKKVYGRCKGFLHIVESPGNSSMPRMTQKVVFTHRSLVEFLETPSFIELAKPYAFDFSYFIIVCGTILRCLEYQQPIPDVFCIKEDIYGNEELERTDYTGNLIGGSWRFHFQTLLHLACKLRPVMPNLVLHCLEAFQDHVLELSRRVEDQPSIASWTIQHFALLGLEFGVTEPLKRARDNFPFLRYDTSPTSYKYALFKMFDNIRIGGLHITHYHFIEVLDCLICFGASFEATTRLRNRSLPMWNEIIVSFMMDQFPGSWCPGIVIDWCLQHGADPDLTVGKIVPGGPHSLQWLEPRPEPKNSWQLLWASSEDFSFENFTNEFYKRKLFIMNETSILCQIIKGNGGVLKLRDLLSYWFPDDEYFPSLIDRLQSGKVGEQSDSGFSPTIVAGPPGKIVRQTWGADYKAYILYEFHEILKDKGIIASYLDGQLVFGTRHVIS